MSSCARSRRAATAGLEMLALDRGAGHGGRGAAALRDGYSTAGTGRRGPGRHPASGHRLRHLLVARAGHGGARAAVGARAEPRQRPVEVGAVCVPKAGGGAPAGTPGGWSATPRARRSCVADGLGHGPQAATCVARGGGVLPARAAAARAGGADAPPHAGLRSTRGCAAAVAVAVDRPRRACCTTPAWATSPARCCCTRSARSR